MDKFTCPYCYEKHTIKDCIYKCSYRMNLGKNANGTPNLKLCVNDFQKNANGTIPNELIKKCQKCNSAKLYRFCPNNKGGKLWEIPDRVLDSNFSVALIGAKASGKSNYIAVLVNEIKKKMSRSFDCSLIDCNQQTRENYQNNYYRPLYENAVAVAATDKGESEPLIYSIDFYDTKGKSYKIKDSVTISLYDTAGENLDSESDMLQNNQYIANATGIILLLDPLQIPAIREQLKDKITLPPKNTDTTDIIKLVINIIKSRRKIKGCIDIPIAMAFTKTDLLAKYDILPEDSCLREESAHTSNGVFVKSDFENTNIEMQSLLENFLEDELAQLLKQFSNYAFFGLSALGDNPDNSNKLARQPEPIRVLDPLLWLLAMEKKIKTVK